MKLYFSPGACSLAPHIILFELNQPFELVKVDLKTKKLSDGTSFEAINPKGSVPVLGLDNGDILTENAVILQYLAAQQPHLALALSLKDEKYYHFLEWLNYIATELHKGFGPLLHSDVPESYKMSNKEKMKKKLEFVSKRMQNQKYILGNHYTVADAYLYTILRWAPKAGLDLSQWPSLMGFVEHMGTREGVRKALSEEKGNR